MLAILFTMQPNCICEDSSDWLPNHWSKICYYVESMSPTIGYHTNCSNRYIGKYLQALIIMSMTFRTQPSIWIGPG